jgi:hypothetical protein
MEKKYFHSFHPDSVSSIEKHRNSFAAGIAEASARLKNLPACCGDKLVKNAALNSLHFFGKEAKNEMPHLEKFLESEEEFILHHQKSKQGALTQEEKDAYRNAVKKYNEDIKAANELVRQLNKTRESHLAAFSEAQASFLREPITAFRE